MSLWDTLPLELADLIMHTAKELHCRPVINELERFHKQRVRTYASYHRRGIELECVKNSVSVCGRTVDLPSKGGTYDGMLYHNDIPFLKRDNTKHFRYYGGGTEVVVWTRNKDALVAHVKQFVPEHEKNRKAKKFPKIEKCTNKQLMHLLITSD
jgi:hypothetical protein